MPLGDTEERERRARPDVPLALARAVVREAVHEHIRGAAAVVGKVVPEQVAVQVFRRYPAEMVVRHPSHVQVVRVDVLDVEHSLCPLPAALELD